MGEIEPLIIKPQDLVLRLSDLSEKVVLSLMKAEEFDVIGIGDAIFLACSAVNIATDIAKAHINELYVDTLEIPILGPMDTIFVRVGREPKMDIAKRIEEEEKGMALTTDRDGQLIAVRRGGRMEALVTLCLIKLSKVEKLKLVAAASAINDAVKLALQITKGPVAKETMGISFMTLYTIPSREDTQKKMTAISIFLRKGRKTEYSKRHEELIKKLKTGLRSA
jgi:hypothetical protein